MVPLSPLGRISALLLFLTGAPASAQEVVPLRESANLAGIRVEQVAVLGDEDKGTIGPNFVFEVAGDGRFLVSYFSRREEMLVFNPDGGFGGSVGRSGEGPGEYRFVRHIKAGDKLVHIFDTRNRRWTRLDPVTWSVVGTSPFPGDPHDVKVVGDSLAFATAIIPTQEGFGLPIHRVGSDGGTDRSFGAGKDEPFRSDLMILARRVIAGGGRDAIWTAHASRYKLEKWSLNGDLLGSYERDVAWFKPHAETSFPDPETPPVPLVTDLQYDEGSALLWVAVGVPDPEWSEGVVRSRYQEGTGFEVGDWDKYLDTVLEAIDVQSGEVVGSVRLDRFIWSFGSGGYAATYFEEDGVLPKIAIWRFEMDVRQDLSSRIDEVQTALESSQWGRVQELMNRRDGKVRWNVEKQAVQVVGCQGQILAHFPFPPKASDGVGVPENTSSSSISRQQQGGRE